MAKYKKKLEEDIRCPLEYELAIFGGKWKSRIICGTRGLPCTFYAKYFLKSLFENKL